jgi:DNA-directed RNA polymerase specialized sigma24 family protein
MPEDNEEEERAESSPLDDADYLEAAYHGDELVEGGATQAEIGEEHGITTRANSVSDERLEDPEWLEEQYVDEEKTMQEIADEVGCSDGTVMRRLHKFDIEVRRSATESDDEEEEAEPAEAEE